MWCWVIASIFKYYIITACYLVFDSNFYRGTDIANYVIQFASPVGMYKTNHGAKEDWMMTIEAVMKPFKLDQVKEGIQHHEKIYTTAFAHHSLYQSRLGG